MQAFVGVAENLNAIVIAFRGTQESRYSLDDGEFRNKRVAKLHSVVVSG